MALTLKALRVNTGMTQAEAANALGVTCQTLSSYERGETFPDVPLIEKIIRLYNVSYEDIIFFT